MAAKSPAHGKNSAPAPIIVKKITVVAAGHHGGAWKVAYADFVTAMMAFFLLLWLLGATTEKQRKGIADYFTPTLVKMRQESAGANGLLHGSSIVDADNYPHRAGQTGTKAMLNSGLRLPDGRIVVVGLAGTVLVSTDGGRAFTLRQQSSRAGIQSVVDAGGGQLLLTGEFGVRRVPVNELFGAGSR